MAYRRAYTQYLTTTATTSRQIFTLDSPDNAVTQHVKGFFAGITTSGVKFALMVHGDEKSSIDATRFAVGDWMIDVDVDLPPGVSPRVAVIDLTNSIHTNIPFTLIYEVDQP